MTSVTGLTAIFIMVAYLFTMSEGNFWNFFTKCPEPTYKVVEDCNKLCQEPAFCEAVSYKTVTCYRCNWNDGIDRKGDCGGIVYKGHCKYRHGFNRIVDALMNCEDGLYYDKNYYYKTIDLDLQFSCYYCVNGLKCSNHTRVQ